MWFDENAFYGFELYDSLKNVIYEPLWKGYKNFEKKEFEIQDGERIIGIKCRANPKISKACHCDMQFILGRLGC